LWFVCAFASPQLLAAVLASSHWSRLHVCCNNNNNSNDAACPLPLPSALPCFTTDELLARFTHTYLACTHCCSACTACCSESTLLHGSMLELADSPHFVKALLANADPAQSYPGGCGSCLQILSMWLSWLRVLYTKVHKVQCYSIPHNIVIVQ
jgi:hypothetical protein